MKRRGNSKFIYLVLLLLCGALLLSGCGGDAFHENQAPNSPSQPAPNPPANSPSDGSDTGIPPVTKNIRLTGDGGTQSKQSFPVITDNILILKITAQAASHIDVPGTFPGFSNFNGSYSCASFKITVGGDTRTTQILHAQGTDQSASCSGAPSSQILDFSESLGRGRTSVQIEVSDARYDYWCKMYGMYAYSNIFCPLRTVYLTHTILADMEVQVNGTRPVR